MAKFESHFFKVAKRYFYVIIHSQEILQIFVSLQEKIAKLPPYMYQCL